MDEKFRQNSDTSDIIAINNNFFEKYNSTIRGIVTNILKYTNQSQDIDDCVNTVFLSLMEKLQQYNETRGSLAAFVIMIARSTALDYRRNNIRRIGKLAGEDTYDFICDDLEFENEVEFNMLIESIHAKLTEKENILFTMKFILYDSTDEIAKILNINKNAVKVRVNRLKNKIKKFLIKGGITIE
ncbi:MAG: sigma-70 family RNA polymerase sigma factor [Oscillospiraceae bacterium]|nr:sigma-70 family RNA polymerase sigma factor [Oscillospiraceae bacterium]